MAIAGSGIKELDASSTAFSKDDVNSRWVFSRMEALIDETSMMRFCTAWSAS
jgi:hypothetical protein